MALFVKLDVNIFCDDRMIEMSPLAQLLYIRCLCLAKRLETDGYLRWGQINREAFDLTNETDTLADLVTELVDCGLWYQDDETELYSIAGWLKHNKSNEWIEKYRAEQAESGRRGGRASGARRRAKWSKAQP